MRNVIILMGRSYRKGLRETGGRGDCAFRGPVVASGKHRHNARCTQSLNIGAEDLQVAVATAPGAVHHVGSVICPRVSIGVQQPLESSVEPAIVGLPLIVEGFDSYPARPRGHPDRRVSSPYDGAHGVGTVPVAIARVGVALVRSTIPVPKMLVQTMRVVAAVLRLQSRVLPIHPAVHGSHHDTSAIYSQSLPAQVGPYLGYVPLHSAGPLLARTPALFLQISLVIGANNLHFGTGCQPQDDLSISFHGQTVEHPVRDVAPHSTLTAKRVQ